MCERTHGMIHADTFYNAQARTHVKKISTHVVMHTDTFQRIRTHVMMHKDTCVRTKPWFQMRKDTCNNAYGHMLYCIRTHSIIHKDTFVRTNLVSEVGYEYCVSVAQYVDLGETSFCPKVHWSPFMQRYVLNKWRRSHNTSSISTRVTRTSGCMNCCWRCTDQFPGHIPWIHNQNQSKVVKGYWHPADNVYCWLLVVFAFVSYPQILCVGEGNSTSTFVWYLVENDGLVVMIISCTFRASPLLPRCNEHRSSPH